MADESLETQDLSAVGIAYAKAFTDDLRALIGAEVTIGEPAIETVASGDVNQDDEPVARTTCKNKKDDEHIYYCEVSRTIAVSLASMLMGHPEERMKEMRELPLDEESLDAFGEVMNLGTAVLSRMFTDQYSLPPVGVESLDDVVSPTTDPPWQGDQELAIARYPIAIPGGEEGSLTMVFPPNLAHDWFGMKIGPYKVAGPVIQEHDLDSVEPTSIVFIEPSEDLRNEIEDLEEDMIHSIWTMDPEEFDPDEMEEFADVGAFFIEWDLAFRTGLDFLECLRGNELTQYAPVLMMSSEPTDSKVRTAIRSGASSFIAKPLVLEQFTARLDPLLLARQRAMSKVG